MKVNALNKLYGNWAVKCLDMGWTDILLMSFFISLGNEFVVPRLIK